MGLAVKRPNPIPSRPSSFSNVKVGPEGFNMKHFHMEMQRIRQNERKDITLKDYLAHTYGAEYTPEKFYHELGVDLHSYTVDKLLSSNESTRWLFPEIFRDAIRLGLDYAPIFPQLIIGEESLQGTGITMPRIGPQDPDELRLRDTAEGATITEGEILVWGEKQVTVHKKARGLKQTYESIMFMPINLATVFFEELGARLGADLDAEALDILINGDQGDGSEAAPVMGAGTANTLTYLDIARVWVRFKRIGRNSTVMLANEADAITILDMDEFNNTVAGSQRSFPGTTISVNTPLPSSQSILVHDSIPAKKLILVDTARALVQLTAMPLLIESEQIVSRQVTGEYVSIITGFANVFKDGRLILDYATDLTTNPGPSTTF